MKGMSEAEFLSQVIDFAHLHGWKVAHFRAARTSSGGWETPCQADAKGFPDLFMLHEKNSRAVAAELKVGRNRPTDEQDEWLDAMERCGITAYVWKPVDWNEIEDVLKNGEK